MEPEKQDPCRVLCARACLCMKERAHGPSPCIPRHPQLAGTWKGRPASASPRVALRRGGAQCAQVPLSFPVPTHTELKPGPP